MSLVISDALIRERSWSDAKRCEDRPLLLEGNVVYTFPGLGGRMHGFPGGKPCTRISKEEFAGRTDSLPGVVAPAPFPDGNVANTKDIGYLNRYFHANIVNYR